MKRNDLVRHLEQHGCQFRATERSTTFSSERSAVISKSPTRSLIANDRELVLARERVARLERLLEDLRKSALPEEWPALSSGYRLEIERMQEEMLDYLVQAVPKK